MLSEAERFDQDPIENGRDWVPTHILQCLVYDSHVFLLNCSKTKVMQEVLHHLPKQLQKRCQRAHIYKCMCLYVGKNMLGKNLHRHLSKNDTQIANRYVKEKSLIPLIIREVQIKTTMRFYLALLEWLL